MINNNIKTIGIIGAGQLCKMLSLSAASLGYDVIAYDENENACSKNVIKKLYVGSFNDYSALREFCQNADVITYEFENIPFAVIEKLASEFNIPQGALPLKVSQERVFEKDTVSKLGVPVAKYERAVNIAQLNSAISKIGYPVVVKTTRFGYDGHGQAVLKSDEDLEKAIKLLENSEVIVEQFVKFDYEISQITVKSTTSEICYFPPSVNIHKNGILHSSVADFVKSDDEIVKKIQKYNKLIMDGLNICGILAVEYFVKGDEVLFNELAPRPHNSGHYSIEGCYISQFEQCIRALCNLKLGDCKLREKTVTINILGQHLEAVKQLVKCEEFRDIKLHLYGKDKAAFNRKIGHLTICSNHEQCINKINALYENTIKKQ